MQSARSTTRVAAAQHVRGDRLAEVHDVDLHHAAAARTARRQRLGIDRELACAEARDAAEAAQQLVIAVDLDQLARARLAMQIVDVLGDDGVAAAERLELDESEVAGVGLRARERLGEGARPRLARREALLPGPLGIAQEALVAIERRLAVLRPQARRARGRAECRSRPRGRRR